MDLKEIKEAEESMDYWKEKAMEYWKMYLRNVMIIRRLREQNRLLRSLLSDYVE